MGQKTGSSSLKNLPLNQEVDTWVRAMRVSRVPEEIIDKVVLKYFEWKLVGLALEIEDEEKAENILSIFWGQVA